MSISQDSPGNTLAEFPVMEIQSSSAPRTLTLSQAMTQLSLNTVSVTVPVEPGSSSSTDELS